MNSKAIKDHFYLENDRITGVILKLKCPTNTMEVIGNIYKNKKYSQSFIQFLKKWSKI